MTAQFSEKITKESLIERINFGDDIEFTLRGKKYTILGWYEHGPLIAETTMPGQDKGVFFKDGEELIEKYKIDDVPLEKIIGEMQMN